MKLFHGGVILRKKYLDQCSPILKEYFGYEETVKGRSSGTVDEYFVDIRTFLRYFKQKKGYVPSSLSLEEIPVYDVNIDLFREVTLLDVYEFMNYVKNERQNNAATRARKVTALRTLFKYLSDTRHYLDSNPLQNLDTPKQKKSLPKYLTMEQSVELLNSVNGKYSRRDYCILTLALNCGLRRAELVNLNISDISSERTLRVHGKGNKERMLYLNDACWEAIQDYLNVRPFEGVIDKDALFLSRLNQRISLQGIHYIVKGYLKSIGAEDYSTHKLRHTAATLMYQQGGTDIRVLKDILGHENLGTTEIYTHLSNKQIKEATENNPLSGLHRKPDVQDKLDNKDKSSEK